MIPTRRKSESISAKESKTDRFKNMGKDAHRFMEFFSTESRKTLEGEEKERAIREGGITGFRQGSTYSQWR